MKTPIRNDLLEEVQDTKRSCDVILN